MRPEISGMQHGATSVWHWGRVAAWFFVLVCVAVAADARAQDWLKTIPEVALASSDITLRQHAEAAKPFTVAGPCGAFLGEQDGSFEAWEFPVKLLSHFTISADVEGYDVPIDLNAHAAEIEVAPDHTTITYSHINFTVREIMYATRCDGSSAGAAGSPGAGIVALFEIESLKPMKLTFSFTPEVRRMWPAPNFGVPSPEWIATGSTGGFYILHTDSEELSGAIAMPGTEPGILAPYQEKAKTYPLQLVLSYDPKRDAGREFPLLMAAGSTAETASMPALTAVLRALNEQAGALYAKTADYYAHFFDHRLSIDTPDKSLDRAIRWGEISIDQARVRHGDEVGLIAGYYSSGDSARPGFGWFFGRDTLYTLFAVNSYGDFALTRQALEFLIKRERADGKVMHEYSQTADRVDWEHLPYFYAAADATPLFLMAMEDYVKVSGDVEFLKSHWDAVERAWKFESTHDSDGDGIYDNAQGTGWVESWPNGMPHQEVYLAALDAEASGSMARLSHMTGHDDEAQQAEARGKKVAETLEHEYAGDSMYAFSRNADGSLDKTATIYPAIAWWDGHMALKQSDAMLTRWASHEFSTDWGTRDLGEGESFYDANSYHQGSVWPLFTGWASVAEYHAGRPLSAHAHLMQNAGLTTAQDIGAVTELLSGKFYQPFGRSSSHQLWSSSMVITPALRGLFGLSYDAATSTLTVDPHLPAEWDHATLHNVPVAGGGVDVEMRREGAALVVRLVGTQAHQTTLRSSEETVSPRGKAGGKAELRILLPPFEVGIPQDLPLPGAVTAQLKALDQKSDAKWLTMELEAQGGSSYDLPLRANVAHMVIHAEGATVRAAAGVDDLRTLHVVFPPGAGYQRQQIRLTW